MAPTVSEMSDSKPSQQATGGKIGAAVIGGIVLGSVAATALPSFRRPQHATSMMERVGALLRSSESSMSLEQQQQHIHAAVQSTLLQFKGDLRQEIQHDFTNTTTHLLASSLQTHERELTKVLGGPIRTVVTHGETMQRQLREISHIFAAPKSLGTSGELQLELIIREILPSVAYDFQSTLSNGKRVDCLLRLPLPIGNLAIDSKFPIIANQPNAVDSQTSVGQPLNASTRRKELQQKLSKHVNDIATKYIIPGETADSAVLFLPSVALFLEIVEHHSDIVLSAHRRKVWLACPTTLAAVLTTMQGVSRGMAIAKQTQHVTQQIQKLFKDIDLLVTRFEAAEKSVEKTSTELSKMQTSVYKIRKIKLELDALSLSSEGPSPTEKASELPSPLTSMLAEEESMLSSVEYNGDHLERASPPTRESGERLAASGSSSL